MHAVLLVVLDRAHSNSVDSRLVDAPVSTIAIPYLISLIRVVGRHMLADVVVFPFASLFDPRCVHVIARVLIGSCLVRPVEDDRSSTAVSYPRGCAPFPVCDDR